VNEGRIWLRIMGTAAIIGALLIYEPGAVGIGQRLGLPLVLAIGALALVQNPAAVALGTLVLSVIHSDLGATSWIPAIAYPLVAALAALALLVIVWRRFRKTIAATRDARWAHRHVPSGELESD
jgi:hypothetical protein